MSDALPAAPPAIAPQYINQDIPCVGCGYNLRGLTADRPCPECGVPVERSLQGDWLAFCNSQWLDTIRRGTTLMLWSITARIVVGITDWMLGWKAPPLVQSFLQAAIASLWAYAVFLITTCEVRQELTERGWNLRRVLRYCALGGVGGGVLVAFSISPLRGFHYLKMLSMPSSLAIMIAFLGTFVHLRRLARRMPDEPLAKSTTRSMWCLVICFGVVGFGGPGSLTACVGLVGIVLFGTLYLTLLIQYRLEFGRLARMAREAEKSLAREIPVASSSPPPLDPIEPS